MPPLLSRVPVDPGRFWIRFTPRRWPSPCTYWVNLAAARLGPGDLKVVDESLEMIDRPDDVLYLPATREEFWEHRNGLVRDQAERGVPTLVQLLPGEPEPLGGLAVLDLAPLLLALNPPDLPAIPLPEWAVWPLVPGISDRPELVAKLGPKLVEAGVRVVTVMRLELSPREKHEFARDREDTTFDALFHQDPVSERPLASALGSLGLHAFPQRPRTTGLPAFVLRRRLAGLLAEAAELDIRCDHHGRGQELYRASRHLDDSSVDLLALYREGNFRVLQWLDPVSRGLVESALSGDGDPLEERRAVYLGTN